MAIINPGDNVIMENVVDGTELARRIERFMAAFHSQNSNPTRPPSLTSGGIWTRTGSPGDPMPMLFDGTTDLPLRPMTWRSTQSVTVDTVLTEANANGRIVVSGTASLVTLPPLAVCPVGSMIMITGNRCGVTVSPGDMLAVAGDSMNIPTTITKSSREDIIFVRGGSVWSADIGNGILPYSGSFERSLAVSGYQKLPGGLVIQWGITPQVAVANTFQADTFPTTFPNACFTILGTSGISGTAIIKAATRIVSSSQFEYTADAVAVVRWMAVGN